MPDILLIQPPIRDFYLTAKRTIPYGLSSIAAALMAKGYSVDIFDALATSKARVRQLPDEMSYLQPFYGRPDGSPFALFHQFRHFGYSFDTIGKAARASGAFLIGISSLFTAYMQEAIRTAEIVKHWHPECRIVLGGHHPTALPQSVMPSPAVDYVIRGEGEVAMPLLADAISNGTPLEGIPGLVYRRKDGQLEIKPPVQMPAPDDFPLPAYQLVKRKFYRRKRTGSLVIVAGRGCPMQCSYCCFGNNSSQTFRKRSVSSIIREIEQAQRVEPLGFIDFEDEHLSLDRRWFLELMNTIQSRFGSGALELRAMNGLYPPSLDGELIRSMKSAGFKTLNLSLGSASKEQLRRFNRPDVRMAFDRALEQAEKYDLNAVGYVICAAPDQPATDSISDLLFLARRRVLAGVSIYYPAPGSRDYDSCIERELLPANLSCLRSSALPLSHSTSRLEAATILRLSRVLNFMKSLLDRKIPLPLPDDAAIRNLNPTRRRETGLRLLGRFLGNGRISGITAAGEVYDHLISENLTRQFLNGIRSTEIRGTR
jgi:radical SAM superfamily enzyme YgiQ (UPF0313 family)